MTAQEQIAKLESLLDRIRRNASKPRTAAPLIAAAPPAAAPPPEPAAPIAAAAPPRPPEPVAAAAPPAPALAYVEEQDEPIPDIEDLDMSDVEVVEIAVEEGDAISAAEDEAPDTVDEPIPESAPRPAAMADVAEPEAPIKTPPPESGRQVVAPIAPIIQDGSAREADLSGSGDVDSLLEADLSGGPISRAPLQGGPTMEQLGATVELHGADAPAALLELDAGPIVRPVAPPADELELELPKRGFSGGYEAELAPPSGATADLRSLETSPPPPPPAPTAESSAPPIEAAPPAAQPQASAGPTIVERPALDARAAEVIAAKPLAKPPETFLDLLDGSLDLRA